MPNAKPAIAPRARPARRSFARAGRLTIAAGPGAGTTTSPAWWKRRLSTPPGWNACRTAFRTARPRRPYERSAIWTSPNFRRSFRRAASAGIDHPSLTLTHVMHRDLPRPSLRATPKALRYGRGSLLCMTWISSRPPPMRGHDWTRKGGRNWKRFDKLQSHYLFADRFGRPGKGNDKGKVEGLVGLIRRNYLVPIPHAVSFAALNAELLADCRRRLGDRLRGHDETIGERLARDLACFHDLPGSPYDACDKQAGRVSSLSLVRYRGNDYSVPTAYGHREVLVRGYVDTVVISCGADIIARHVRSYEREDFVFNPLHYLALLERKIGALDQAAPLAGWDLPEAFTILRRLLEARMGKQGKREFVQVLRLMEVFEIEDVAAGVRDAIDRGVIGFDAVKHLVLCRIERRPARLDMTVYPYLPRASVAITSARSYLELLAGAAP